MSVAALASAIGEVQAAPETAALHARMAGLLNDLGRPGEAVGAALIATELEPLEVRGHAELARAFLAMERPEAALGPCITALTLDQYAVSPRLTLASVLYTLGRSDGALQAASEAVALAPTLVPARVILALALEACGRLDEAEAQARMVVALDPDSAVARHNLASLRLSRGKLDSESWQLYDARFGLSPAAEAIARVPRWQGEPVAGRTMLIHAEQGAGDVIQFVRYATMVRDLGARVVLVVPRSLVRLMESVPGLDEVIEVGSALPRFDVFCPIASLPGVFGTTLASIPAPGAYVTAPAVLPSSRTQAGPMRVGLAWAGNAEFVHDKARSIDPRLLAAWHSVANVEFVNLQFGQLPPFPMTDEMSDVADFADTAELIVDLDLVVTVDTAIAHLAGAMGKPVWLLSRHMGCWRWLRDRNDSPWYPTMRIFRQRQCGQWPALLTEVKDALVSWAADRCVGHVADGNPLRTAA